MHLVESAIQISPLAEKRVLSFLLRKQMIGRRAYTDSAQTVLIKMKSENRNGYGVGPQKPKEKTQKQRQQEQSDTQKYIETVAFEVFAC